MISMINPLKNLTRPASAFLSRSVTSTSASEAVEAGKKINPAMKYYMEKRRKHDEFMAEQRAEFEIGKAHLANMMGMEADLMTQADIDLAIEYLFPTGLSEAKARPIMKPPEVVFPKQKDAEFDFDGRPFHPFFFTRRPLFYQSMYEVAEHINNVSHFADLMRNLKVPPNPEQILDSTALAATRWMNLEELTAFFIEGIREKDVEDLVKGLERLLESPFAYKAKDFIFK